MSTHIEKIRVPVRLSQPKHDPRDGWFMLDPHLEQDDRPESVVELLNSSRTVIPFIEAGDESVLLLMRDNIDWVAVGEGVPIQLVLPPGPHANVEQHVVLRFTDESRVEGTIAWRSEGNSTRLSDHLSATDAFVAIKTRFGTLIANKARVRETRIATDAAAARVTPQDEDGQERLSA
jgi:hypothetical protein